MQSDRRMDGRTDGRTDGQTDMVIPVYPPNFVAGGIKTKRACALHFVFARLTTVVFRWRSKKDGDKPAFFDRFTAYLQS